MDTKTTYHRDGTVTLWDVYEQRWLRVDASQISNQLLATLTPAERARIAKIAAAQIGGAR
jgi:hypothetical protein